jgi:glucose/arabinose dehydrogenase
MKFWFLIVTILTCITLHATPLESRLQDIKLPPGFHISIFAEDVSGARSIAVGKEGTVFIGSRSAGRVYALVDSDGDWNIDERYVIASRLNSPNGVAFRDGSLYVAEIDRVTRYDNIENRLQNPPRPVTVNATFPDDVSHGWKFIRFGPDGKLYVPVGIPCNVCRPEDGRFGTIMRMEPDGSELEIYAHGVRNSVGFDWHPESGKLYFTDNGRDWLGNTTPPDELNRVDEKGQHFGFPYCHGKEISDPEFGETRECSEFIAPVQELGAHVASLGMRFYTGMQFPDEYRNQILIAEHGSWNRFPPYGYRITLVKLKDEKAVSYTVFAEGWLQGVRSWGRPVDIEVMYDGSLLVSDDKAGAVYRIRYEK